jgi:thiol-disulfide isomerase/thioredoxin
MRSSYCLTTLQDINLSSEVISLTQNLAVWLNFLPWYVKTVFFTSWKVEQIHALFVYNSLVMPLPQERQALSMLGIALLMKFLRRQSLDGFFVDAFFFCKSAIALVTWYMDYRWSIMYILSYLGAAIAFPQPFYRGETKMTEFTPQTLVDNVEGESDKSVTWIVELFAPWSPQCLVLEPVLAEISTKYSSEKLKFGKIDVSRWPSVAKTYNVNLTGVSDQLPTIIRFRQGKEDGRIPQVSNDGKKVYSGKYRKHDIIAAFELDK